MNALDRLLVCEVVNRLSVQEQKKAEQILTALEGISIRSAQKVLDACKAALIELMIKY